MSQLYFWYLSDDNFCQSERGNTFAFKSEKAALAAVKGELRTRYEKLCKAMHGTNFTMEIEALSADYPQEYWVRFTWNALIKNMKPFINHQDPQTPWGRGVVDWIVWCDNKDNPDFNCPISTHGWRINRKCIEFSTPKNLITTHV